MCKTKILVHRSLHLRETGGIQLKVVWKKNKTEMGSVRGCCNFKQGDKEKDFVRKVTFCRTSEGN